MKEKLISYDTAVLAYFKNYPNVLLEVYPTQDFFNGDYKKGELSFLIEESLDEEIARRYCVSAPTQSLLQRWLRELHSIHLTVIPVGHSDYTLKYFYYSILGVDCENGKPLKNRFNSYEEALEKGLQEGLKLINNEKTTR